jgi:superfamily II DNA or RNA helicase
MKRNKSKNTKKLSKNVIDAVIMQKGYIINKESLPLNDIKLMKEELYVMPEIMEEFSQNIKPYPMYHENEKQLIVPRYYGIKKYGNVKKEFNYETVNFEFNGSLRQYQIDIVDNVLPKIIGRGGGLISLPCGRGKTVIALYLSHKLGLKTLVLVHKTFLQDQWIARAKEFTNAKLGIIRQNTIDVEGKDIVIGMIQSISMKNYDRTIFEKFGTIIVDECHHIASKVFSRALYKTGTEYTIGLSATPNRMDGLTKIIYWYIGRVLYKEDNSKNDQVVVRKLDLLLNDPLFVEKTMYTKMGQIPSIPKMISNLCKIKRRNHIILRIIDILRKNPKRKILILSNRISHLEYLKKKTDQRIENDVKKGLMLDNEYKTFYYIGKTKPNERKQAEMYGDILFASYEMAQEGLDISSLNTLILSTPKRSITQAIGRIMRKILSQNDTKPLIIDVCDNVSVFLKQGDSRYNLYRRNKYKICEYIVDDYYQTTYDKYNKNNQKIDKKDNIKISQIFNESELNKNIDICQKRYDNKCNIDFDKCLIDLE